MTIADLDTLAAAVRAELPGAVALRHRLHADPRRSGEEADTAAAVADAVGIPGTPIAGTGRLLHLTAPRGGPVVVLRAELDGLPLTERTGVAWASPSAVMHACGHDVHCAAVVAVARALRGVDLPCEVAVLLQPREESAPAGARDVVVDPAFTALDVRAVVGAHVQPVLERGQVGTTPGAVNAAGDELDVVVSGAGGHGAYPHRSTDPVLALAHVVVGLHHLVSRRVDPLHPTVITVGEMHAGTAPNVIPERAAARATLRTLDEGDRALLIEAARGVVEHVAAAHGCTGTLEVTPVEPALVNDPALTAAAAARLPAGLAPAPFRSCGSDDFAFYGERVPSVMLFVGTGGPHGLHHPEFLPSDDLVGEVAATYLAGLLGGADLLRG